MAIGNRVLMDCFGQRTSTITLLLFLSCFWDGTSYERLDSCALRKRTPREKLRHIFWCAIASLTTPCTYSIPHIWHTELCPKLFWPKSKYTCAVFLEPGFRAMSTTSFRPSVFPVDFKSQECFGSLAVERYSDIRILAFLLVKARSCGIDVKNWAMFVWRFFSVFVFKQSSPPSSSFVLFVPCFVTVKVSCNIERWEQQAETSCGKAGQCRQDRLAHLYAPVAVNL